MQRLIVCLFVFLLAAPVAAQPCPGFPARGIQIIDALYNASLAQGSDDQRRQLTRTYIEQLVFEFPLDGWTWKSADPGRPPSKDSISKLVAGRLCNWDWQNGSTRLRSVQAGQVGEDITGQNPIPVAGVNHLVDVPSPPPPTPQPLPPPVPQPAPIDWSGVYQRFDLLSAQLERSYADLVNRNLAVSGQVAGVSQQVKEHDEKVSVLTQFFGNRYVQMLLAAGGAIAAREAAK